MLTTFLRAFILLIALAACSTGQPSSAPRSASSARPASPPSTLTVTDAIGRTVNIRRLAPPRDDGFRPGEEIVTDTSQRADTLRAYARLGMPTSRTRRIGFDPETGFAYRYYGDGSGSVTVLDDPDELFALGDWSFGCSVDRMTDVRTCHVSNDALYIEYGGRGSVRSVCVIGHDFPGRRGAIRIDQASPISTPESGCITGQRAQQVATSLRGADRVVSRRVEWPYDNARDRVTERASGFRLADALLRWWMAGGSSVTFDESAATLATNQAGYVTGFRLARLQNIPAP